MFVCHISNNHFSSGILKGNENVIVDKIQENQDLVIKSSADSIDCSLSTTVFDKLKGNGISGMEFTLTVGEDDEIGKYHIWLSVSLDALQPSSSQTQLIKALYFR